MRKFNFLSFLIGVIAVGGVGAFALSSQYLKSDGTPNFQELKSTRNSNQLNSEMRDQLMDGLSKMQEKIPTTNGETIPAGAVMAFNLSSCPDGWSPFTEANDRFIMGSQANLREKGGNSEIQLTIGQLPPHSFYLFGDYALKDSGNKINPFFNDYQYTSTKRSKVPKDWDSNNQYYINSTPNTPDRGKTNTLGSGNSINIQNPYIKLLYCVKGKAVDGLCGPRIYSCSAGTVTDEQAQRHDGKNGGTSSRYRKRTCQGENGGKSQKCEKIQN